MTLASGTRLGPYEITSPLGAGGMGEVYRAKDTRLERSVALKVLPAHLSAEAELKARLTREARAISALNHPHICALYDVGSENGIDYLVMELLEGETLADRLLKGPLPADQVLSIGIEIADALDRAHRQGIVHRDLKPGNVMLTKSGVKLLDFGLAKLKETGRDPVVSSLPTRFAEKPLTEKGTVLGTFQYMSPEQLEGKDVDARSDIFALGALLYEASTGRRAFSGASQASLIAAILSSEPPPISSIQKMAPPALDRLVRTCLAKDPDQRWQSAHDVASELKWIADGGSQVGARSPVAERRRSRERIAWSVAAVAALLAVALAIQLGRSRAAPLRPIRSFLVPPENTAFRMTGDDSAPIVISPDGERVAFGTGDTLWVQSLPSGAASVLKGTEGGKFPFWSPDSRSIGFFSDGKLRVIEASGGPVRALADSPNPRGGTWGADGTIVFAPDFRTGLQRVPAAGGAASPLTRVDGKQHTTHRWPSFLPDGRHVLYLAANHKDPHSEQAGIYVASLDGKESRRLVASWSSAQYASGWLLSVVGTSLVGQRFDPRALVLSGQPVRIMDNVNFDDGVWRGTFSASENGRLVFQVAQAAAGGQLTWVDSTGRSVGTLGERSTESAPRLAPDGRRASVLFGDPNNDIWVYELPRGVRTRLTTDAQVLPTPQWSPDGSRILYATQPSSEEFIVRTTPTSGAVEEKVVTRSKERLEPTDWSRDGRWILVDKGNIGSTDVWALPLDEPGAGFPIVASPALRSGGQFSPDGRWVAYNSRETGRWEVYVSSFPQRGARWQVSARGGAQPRWSPDGRRLTFMSPEGELTAADLDTSGSRVEVRDVKPQFRVRLYIGPRLLDHAYDVAPDGRRFLMNVAGEASETRVALAVNWDAELPR